jgi:hypothetical protein
MTQIVVCRDTGTAYVRGRCPVHGGDNCWAFADDGKHGRWVDPLPNSRSDSVQSADSYLPGALPPAGDPKGSGEVRRQPVWCPACQRFHPALPDRQQSGSEQQSQPKRGDRI